MNSTITRKKLITGAVGAIAVAAAGTSALPGNSPSTPAVRQAPSVATMSATPALAARATPNSLYANGIRALPAGYYAAPVTTGLGGPDTFPAAGGNVGDVMVSNPSLFFAPTTRSRSTSTADDSREGTLAVGSGLTSDAGRPTSFGLFSPTGAFLGLVGPGGLLIGDGVLPGQNAGLLIGNGADGGEGQDGGDGGFIYGNGGNGGGGGSQKPGGNGGNSGFLFSNGGKGGNGADAVFDKTTGALISPATAGGNGGNAGVFGHGGNGGDGGDSGASFGDGGRGGNGGDAVGGDNNAGGAGGDGGSGSSTGSDGGPGEPGNNDI